MLFFFNSRATKSPHVHSLDTFALDTIISISLYDDIDDESASNILAECNKIISHYEDILSRTKEGSDIYNINHAHGEAVVVDDDTLELIKISIDFAERSKGTIDPTIGALSTLWNIGSNSDNTLPSDKDISTALDTVDYKNIVTDDKSSTVTLSNKNSRLDLGFIAKGYISDKLKEYLQSEGIKSAAINLGGNITVIGHKPDLTDFNIGITNPLNKDGEPIDAVKAADTSVVSSGNYERYFEVDGIRYHHILSTRDGYPVNSGLSQVTIICENSTTADALSTLCFILGYDESIDFLNKYYPDVEAIFVDDNGKILK